MSRKANPYTKVLKRLVALQARAKKLDDEIASITEMVKADSRKVSFPKGKTLLKIVTSSTKKQSNKGEKAPAKTMRKDTKKQVGAIKARAKPKSFPKKRMPKYSDSSPDNLATLNQW